MILSGRGLFIRHAVAISVVAVALFLTTQISLLSDRTPFALFFGAVIVATWFGGRVAGLTALVLSAIVCDYFIVPPIYSFIPDLADAFQIATFVTVSLLLVFLTSGVHRREKSPIDSEARYRTLFDYSPDGILIADDESYYLDANKTMCQMLGYSRDELIGLHPSHIVSTSEVLEIGTALKIINSEAEYQREWQFRRKDGSTFPGEVIATKMPDGNLLGVVRDLTQRKKDQEELHKSREQLAGIIGSAMDAIITIDGEQRTVLFNSAAEKMFELTATDALGKPIDIFLPQRYRDGHADHIRNFGETNVTRRSMASLGAIFGLRSTGEEFPIEASISQLESGGEKYFTVILRDITERKDTERKQRKLNTDLINERERLNNIVASVPGVVWETWGDPDASRLKVDFVSDYIEKMLGYSVDEWLSVPDFWLTIVHPDDSEKASAIARTAFSGGDTSAGEFRWIAKDGREVWVETHSVAIRDVNDQAIGMRGVTIDITRRKELEEQFRQSQKMEAIGLLAGGVAHDFNNLLTAITGYSDLALRKIATGDPVRHNIHEIRKASDRAAALTAQLLAFSRKQIINPRVHNLNSVLTEIEKMLRRIIKEDVDLRIVLDPELGNIRADSGQIEQVIVNLAINARDAMPDGGILTIETENVFIDEHYVDMHITSSPGPYIRMTVTDTGEGMSDVTQKRIFEPFFTTKATGKGTGLGLSTVHGIVKQSGGSIHVYSEMGHGTTFKVYLPCVDEEVQTLKWNAGPGTDLSGTETILLIEDEDIVRDLVRSILVSYGYNVLEARGGMAALGICETHHHPIDLMLSDVIMPAMSGTQLKYEVVKFYPTIKVIFMSGYTDDAISSSGVLTSGAAFIEKPFTPDALARKVREILDS